MSEKIVQLNEAVIKSELKELMHGSVEVQYIGNSRYAKETPTVVR